MGLSYKTPHLTKNIVVTMFCISLFLGFALIWFLLGDMNILNMQWLMSYHGTEWSGKVTSVNYQWLFSVDQYRSDIQWWAEHPTKDDIPQTTINTSQEFLDYANQYFASGMTILSIGIKFNPLILIPIISLVVLSVVIPFICRIFKKMNIDVFIFSIPLTLAAVAFIFSGFIPKANNDGLIIFARVVILFAIMTVMMLICNKVIGYIISNSGLGSQAIVDITEQERERNQTLKRLRELQEERKKQDTLTHVDLGKED